MQRLKPKQNASEEQQKFEPNRSTHKETLSTLLSCMPFRPHSYMWWIMPRDIAHSQYSTDLCNS